MSGFFQHFYCLLHASPWWTLAMSHRPLLWHSMEDRWSIPVTFPGTYKMVKYKEKKNVFICTLCILTKWFSSIACFDTAQHVKAMSDEIKRLPHLQKSLRTVLLCKWCSFSPGNFWKSLSFYYSMKGILVVNIKNKFVGYLRNFLWEW